MEGLREDIEAFGVTIVPFTVTDAETAASLWEETASAGLSLADRACLALAMRLSTTALTADRSWRETISGIEIRTIR